MSNRFLIFRAISRIKVQIKGSIWKLDTYAYEEEELYIYMKRKRLDGGRLRCLTGRRVPVTN